MKLTFVHSYFNNQDDFAERLAVWTQYPLRLRRQLQIVIVDDTSPTPLTLDREPRLNLSIFRITKDMGYNSGGARNLGAHVADDGWLFLADIDHEVPVEACEAMLALPADDRGVFYTFQRRLHSQPFRPNMNVFMIHRTRFWNIGGYDEDLSGAYGGEDFLLRQLMSRQLREVPTDITLQLYGNTRYTFPATEPDRSNLSRNDRLIEGKLKNPSYKPQNPLRFSWVEVATYRVDNGRDRESASDGSEMQADFYASACRSAVIGDCATASERFNALDRDGVGHVTRALAISNLGAMAATTGDVTLAGAHFRRALEFDAGCEEARANLALLDERVSSTSNPPHEVCRCRHLTLETQFERPVKVAILSLLFNWPSTGGGIIHTIELAHQLSRAGYDTRHFFAENRDWGVGRIDELLAHAHTAIEFDEESWHLPTVQQRFREHVDQFSPDYVIITDSWNTKPLLAEAVKGYPFFLRLQAQEMLCPLNNLRLLAGGRQCQRHQLATPAACYACLNENRHISGSLHEAERRLAGVGSQTYYDSLRWAVGEAEAVLVVNPLAQAMIEPYAKAVHVVPSGFDTARFPWPWRYEPPRDRPERVARLLFASLTEDGIKGFHILRDACRLLWERRQDFELTITGHPHGSPAPYERYIGWKSQAELPSVLRSADVLIFPTIAQEALGRTAVEAMGVGRPVVASRIGGLQFTVVDGATGLLVEPGNPRDLASKIERLLDKPRLREQMGLAGRRRFEEHFTWDVIIDRHYRALMPARRTVTRPHNGTLT